MSRVSVRSFAMIVFLAGLLGASCAPVAAPAGASSPTAPGAASPTGAASSTGAASLSLRASASPAASSSFGLIVGTWRGLQRCADIVKALTRLGFAEFIPDDIVGNGLRPDLTSNDQLDIKNPCEGAVDREHFHDFYPDGRFDSIDYNGQQVDDGTFTTTAGHVTIGEVTFDVAFHGDSAAVVTVKVPTDCATTHCRENYAWATMVTMPGSTWERVH